MTKGKKGLSREQAGELYQDLQRTMAKMLKNEAEYYNAKGIKVPASNAAAVAAVKGDAPSASARPNMQASVRPLQPLRSAPSHKSANGAYLALAVVIGFAAARVVLSGLEFSGFASVSPVEASYMNAAGVSSAAMKLPKSTPMQFSKEEMQILTSLDSRRMELDDRNKRLDDRAQDMDKKDKEFALRITELRELSDKLGVEREKSDHKKSAQLEQLSNVYGSMNPEEAAHLMEQLDITISLSLIERMPEKRIGQILALMNPERALAITKMLSGKAR